MIAKMAIEGKEGIAGLEDRPDFISLVAQTKFFRGDSNFEKRERAVIEQRIRANSEPKMLEQFFKDTLLNMREDRRQVYGRSDLKAIFNSSNV